MDPKKLVDLMVEAGKLKKLRRTGWVDSGVPRPESVADHSFRTALLSLVLADAERLDTMKVVRMALIHDLAEVTLGDLTPNQKLIRGEAHEIAEGEIMDKFMDLLNDRVRELFLEAWEEYVAGESDEAVLVKDADKLEMVIQALEYEESGELVRSGMRFWHAKPVGALTSEIYNELKRRRSQVTAAKI